VSGTDMANTKLGPSGNQHFILGGSSGFVHRFQVERP
jgi:hypothetical protein